MGAGDAGDHSGRYLRGILYSYRGSCRGSGVWNIGGFSALPGAEVSEAVADFPG